MIGLYDLLLVLINFFLFLVLSASALLLTLQTALLIAPSAEAHPPGPPATAAGVALFCFVAHHVLYFLSLLGLSSPTISAAVAWLPLAGIATIGPPVFSAFINGVWVSLRSTSPSEVPYPFVSFALAAILVWLFLFGRPALYLAFFLRAAAPPPAKTPQPPGQPAPNPSQLPPQAGEKPCAPPPETLASARAHVTTQMRAIISDLCDSFNHKGPTHPGPPPAPPAGPAGPPPPSPPPTPK